MFEITLRLSLIQGVYGIPDCAQATGKYLSNQQILKSRAIAWLKSAVFGQKCPPTHPLPNGNWVFLWLDYAIILLILSAVNSNRFVQETKIYVSLFGNFFLLEPMSHGSRFVLCFFQAAIVFLHVLGWDGIGYTVGTGCAWNLFPI